MSISRRRPSQIPAKTFLPTFQLGQTCYQESTIARCTTCFCQCLSENGNTGSPRLHSYYTCSWTDRNSALHAKTQDTELIVHAQLIRRLYKLEDSFANSAKQYFHLPPRTNPVLTFPKSEKMASACSPGCSSC